MSNNLTITKGTACKSLPQWEMDGFIKIIQAVLLASIPFLLKNPISFILLFTYLLGVTFVSRIKPRTLITSSVSYCIVFLIPFLFGILMNHFLYMITGDDLFADNQGTHEVYLRLIRLFLIWYISILYFNTTPIQTVVGLFDMILKPIKLIGVPVSDFLKIVMYVVMDLSVCGTEIKESLGEKIREAAGGSGKKFKINIKTISQIIVSLIINSFDRLDKIEKLMGENNDEIYKYSFRLTKKDGISVLSFILFVVTVLLIERG